MQNAPTMLQPVCPVVTPAADSQRLTLPMDLRQQAVKRLYYVAAAMGALWSISLLAQTLASVGGHLPAPSAPTTIVRLFGILVAGAMIAVAGSRRVSVAVQCDFGIFFEVVGAATLVSYEQTLLPELGIPAGPVSLVCLWILLFRLFIPASSSRALAAGLLSVATLPLATIVLGALGQPTSSLALTGLQIKIAVGTALAAWLAARVIYRIGRSVSEARTLGAYRLEERLGSGGMGEVWRASHARLKRPSAIKLIDPEVLGHAGGDGRRSTLARFEREVQATAELSSPHTITIYDYGATQDGSLYYVMEYLDGYDLETLVTRTGPVPPARAAHLLRQVCSSLTEAHAHGLVHRDIKPANIFVAHVGAEPDFVKVLDFGLVKGIAQDDQDDQDVRVTRDGVVNGTPAFMAPEMVLGDRRLDARTDVYLLGCTAYWLLTGQLVFQGRTAMAMMSGHVHSEPVSVSSRSEYAVPDDMEALIMQCLAKDPSDRPASTAELAQRLSELRLESAWLPERAARWWAVNQL